MNRPTTLLLVLLSAASLSSCALPKNHSQVLHGKVRGGDVPLYMMGSLPDFSNAGLILGRYVRTEYDILDLDSNGFLCASWKHQMSPLAQVAIPRLVTSIDIPARFEVRYALPAEAPYPPASPGIAANNLRPSPSASAPHAVPPSLDAPGGAGLNDFAIGSSYFETVMAANAIF